MLRCAVPVDGVRCCIVSNGVTNGRGRAAPTGKRKVKTGPPLVDILILSILLVVVFLIFRGVFIFFT